MKQRRGRVLQTNHLTRTNYTIPPSLHAYLRLRAFSSWFHTEQGAKNCRSLSMHVSNNRERYEIREKRPRTCWTFANVLQVDSTCSLSGSTARTMPQITQGLSRFTPATAVWIFRSILPLYVQCFATPRLGDSYLAQRRLRRTCSREMTASPPSQKPHGSGTVSARA